MVHPAKPPFAEITLLLALAAVFGLAGTAIRGSCWGSWRQWGTASGRDLWRGQDMTKNQ